MDDPLTVFWPPGLSTSLHNHQSVLRSFHRVGCASLLASKSSEPYPDRESSGVYRCVRRCSSIFIPSNTLCYFIPWSIFRISDLAINRDQQPNQNPSGSGDRTRHVLVSRFYTQENIFELILPVQCVRMSLLRCRLDLVIMASADKGGSS